MLAHSSTCKFIHLSHQSIKEFTVVTHHNHRAIKCQNCLFKHIFGAHIEVVRRFIKNQEVHRFEKELYHGQTTTFTTRKYLYFLLRGLTTKHKGTEDITDFQSNISLCHMIYRVKNGEFIIEQLCLILRIITELYIMSYLQHSSMGNLLHDTLHERRFAFTILTDKRHFFSTLNGKIHLIKDNMLTIVLFHFITNHWIVTTPGAWWKFKMKARSVNFINLNGNYFFQLFDAALHLHSFGRLITESFDEILQIRNFFLLIFISTELALSAFSTELHIFIIRHTIVHHLATRNL